MIFRLTFLLLLASVRLPAASWYVTQAGAGSQNGTSAGNAWSLAGLNSWTNIAAGDTVHLQGTFTNYASGLVIGGSGTAGSPITILFDSGANFTAGYWPTAINLNNQAYVVIDGGANGFIQATNNGTLLQTNDSKGVYGNSCGSGIIVQNLVLSNLFNKFVFPVDTLSNSPPSVSGIYIGMNNANGTMVSNCVIRQAGNAITVNYSGNCTNCTIINNVASDVSFGCFVNCTAAGIAKGFYIGGLVVSNQATWDGTWQITNHVHNDGIIINGTPVNATNDAFIIERNLFGYNASQFMSSFIKVTPNWPIYSNMKIINNVMVNDNTNANLTNAGISSTENTNCLIACNSIINIPGLSATNMPGIKIGGDGTGNSITYLTNNLFFQCERNITTDVNFTNILGEDYNCLKTNYPAPYDAAFYGQGGTFWSYTDWTNHTKFEQHAQTATPSISLSTFGPAPGDTVLVGNGANLTALSITNDYYGSNRPPSGPWTIGAVQGTNSYTPPVASGYLYSPFRIR